MFNGRRDNKSIYIGLRNQYRYSEYLYRQREQDENYIVLVALADYISKLEKQLESFFPITKPIKNYRFDSE